MKEKGQNLVEFGVIFALVVIAGILSLTLLGDNVRSMFGLSTEEYKNFKPFGDVASSPSDPGSLPGETPGGEDPYVIPTDPVIPGSGEITQNPDGSVNLTIGGQDIMLSSSQIDKLNTVFDTTGSNGMTDTVIAAIEKLIAAHKDEYPGQDVPIEMVFGKGDRYESEDPLSKNYGGDATGIHSIALSVGNHVIVIQKDKTSDQGSIIDNNYIHTLEITGTTGNISSNKSSINEVDVAVETNNSYGLPSKINFDGGHWNFDFYDGPPEQI
jgi:Flp pilus assembly pilin Flp